MPDDVFVRSKGIRPNVMTTGSGMHQRRCDNCRKHAGTFTTDNNGRQLCNECWTELTGEQPMIRVVPD